MNDCVLVLDFGGQYTQLIARKVRELGVYSEIRPCTAAPSSISKDGLRCIILSGGPASVTASDAPGFDPKWLELGVPVLGICYGIQLMAHLTKGILACGESREYGRAVLEVLDTSDLFFGFEHTERTPVWMSHGDHIAKLPEGFRLLARSAGSPVAAIGDSKRRLYGIQFHPEVVHTPRGKEILSNFIFGISNCAKNWNCESFIESSVSSVRKMVAADAHVICGLSGGVDSTVAAVLVNRAIAGRLQCIFVDNGFLRKDEAREVLARLGRGGQGLNVKMIDASARFISALKGVTEPEQKRKIIGRVFIEVFETAACGIPNVTHLVQGTLYPDVIESVSARGGPSATIKTHHNVGGLPERMQLKLIEPLRELFKDEVRRFGRELDIPEELLMRHPFPGPGLAVRVLGAVSEERLGILREADHILNEEIAAENLYSHMWQAFAVLLPVKSVGVMGDGRTYEEVVALRAVTSEDGMTADWFYLPEELLRRVSNRIINEVKGVNRVVLDISSKPPATIEWE